MLAGLEPLDAGAIYIGDRDVSAVRPRRDIAMVFQNYALYPQLTVAENMGFALKQKGVPKAERIIQVREAARILDLEPYLDRKPKHLSGGQRQRSAMGRAIVRHPQVYLMDEPLSNLDAKLRGGAHRAGRAAAPGGDHRVRHPRPGRGDDDGSSGRRAQGRRVAAVRHPARSTTPDNLFVAGFIGSPAMNLTNTARSGSTVAIGGQRVELSAEAHAALDGVAGERVVLGFRPESVVIGGEIPAVVRVVEDLGAEVFVHLGIDHEGQTFALVAKVAAPFPGIVGEATSIRIVGAVHVFDPGGQRLDVALGVPSLPV